VIKKTLQTIFKKISYFFFIKIYGKIESSIKSNSDDRIEVSLANVEKDLKYQVYKIINGRLYTDRIHDTAIILENKIIEGPSFQLRDNNNSLISNNIVFEKGTPRKLRELDGSALSLLTGGGGNSNYWHWLYDVLPRIKLCEKIKKIEEINYFILPSLEKKFQIETLEKLNISKEKMLSSEKFRHLKAKELIVTDHPYVFSNNSHKDAQNIPEWISLWLKEKFLSNLKPTKKVYPKKIFIDRADSNTNLSKVRSIINEQEIKNFLIKKDFEFVKLQEFSFLEQVNYFNNADYIVGLHGGGFANMSFCRTGTKIIEFRMKNAGTVIENLAKKNNLKYDSITLNLEDPNYDKQSGHIKIPINILEKKIHNA